MKTDLYNNKNSNTYHSLPLSELPLELILRITSFLSLEEISVLVTVNKTLHQYASFLFKHYKQQLNTQVFSFCNAILKQEKKRVIADEQAIRKEFIFSLQQVEKENNEPTQKLKTFQVKQEKIAFNQTVEKYVLFLKKINIFQHQQKKYPLKPDTTKKLQKVYALLYARLWQGNSDLFELKDKKTIKMKSNQIKTLNDALAGINDFWQHRKQCSKVMPFFKGFTVEWSSDHTPPGTFAYCVLKEINFLNIMIHEIPDFFKSTRLFNCIPTGDTLASPYNFRNTSTTEIAWGLWIYRYWGPHDCFSEVIDLYKENFQLEQKNIALEEENKCLSEELKRFKIN